MVAVTLALRGGAHGLLVLVYMYRYRALFKTASLSGAVGRQPMSMHIELVTIGTELLLGFTVDTNSAEIGPCARRGRRSASSGERPCRRSSRHPGRRARGAGPHRRRDHHRRAGSHR